MGVMVMHGAEAIEPDKVAIYIRWSTEDQGDGTTLVVQQEGCQHYLLSQGWRVTPSLIFIDDGYSGGSLERPRLTELRLAVKAGRVDCVVVYKLDRLSRSVMDTVNLVLGEWEGLTYLKSAREPVDTTSPMGKQFFYMLVSYAEWERNVIKERTFSGKVRRAREGKHPGGPVPLGYRLSGQAGILESDPQQAELVRRIFRMYLAETGTFRIADQLNRDGIPSPAGLKWNVNTLLKILKNPLYCGRLRYMKVTANPRRARAKSEPWYLKNTDPIETAAQSPPLISPAEFERVQALMAGRHPAKAGVRALGSDHLLTGILHCACGARMVSHASGRGTAKTYAYYACQTYKGRGKGACPAGLIPQSLVDAEVELRLRELLQGDEACGQFRALRRQTLEAQAQETAARREAITRAIEALADQTRRLNRDYRAGHLSATSYETHHREIESDSDNARKQLLDLDRLGRSLACQLRDDSSVPALCDLVQRWESLDVPERKSALRSLLESAVAFKPAKACELSVRLLWKFRAPTDE